MGSIRYCTKHRSLDSEQIFRWPCRVVKYLGTKVALDHPRGLAGTGLQSGMACVLDH
jgi:hypothetical protein